MRNRELEVKRLKLALAVLALPQIRSYSKSNELDPAKIGLLRKELARIIGENMVEEILELAKRIFRETWKKATEDPEVTFYDVAAELLG